MKYILNTNTGTLHIAGYCSYPCTDNKVFKSEEAARAYGQLYIKNCKTCFRKREKELSKNSQ